MLPDPSHRTAYFLCYAENAEQAKESFGALASGREVVQLNWGELSELTGCHIPCQCRLTEYANGNLQFRYKSYRITVWHNIIWAR